MSSFMSTPNTPTLLPTVAMQLSQLSLEYAQHAQPGVAVWLSHPSLEYAHHTHSPLCQLSLRGYLTYPWRMPTTPALLPAVATWLSHQSLEYAHHVQPGVAMWLSHPSLEYAHHALLSASASCGYVAISLIPGSRPPFYQLWLRGFSSIPGVRTPRPARCAYLTYPWSRPTTPTLCQLWLSHLSLDHAHHAHPSTSCGYVALPRGGGGGATQLSQLSLKYTHPIASCDYKTSHMSQDYAHHAQPAAGVVAMWPSRFSPAGIQRLASIPPEYALHIQPFRQLWLPYTLPSPFPNPGVQPPRSPHAQPQPQPQTQPHAAHPVLRGLLHYPS